MAFRGKFSAGFAGCLLLVCVLPLAAGGNKDSKVVDSGTFGIFVNGRRVGSEVFQIEQLPDMSLAKAELKVEDGSNKAVQSAELQLTPGGDLRRYEWKELAPGKAVTTVEPDKEFLIEHTSASPSAKTFDQPFILPASTMILDDYFFSQREILLWRYLAACRPEQDKGACRLDKAQFGVLVPRMRSPIMVTLSYVGREKVNLRGQQHELDHFNLQAEGIDWSLWMDKNYKLQRILIAANNTEVVRD